MTAEPKRAAPSLEGHGRDDSVALDDVAEIARLAKLPPIEYERERKAAVKRLGIERVSILDRQVKAARGEHDQAGGEGAGQPTPKEADLIIGLVPSAKLFHAPDGTGYADLDVNGHRETWPLRSKGFRSWLARRFFEVTQGAPRPEAMRSALDLLEAKAHFDGPEREVHVRVGGLDGKLYLDLTDDAWQAVEIDDAAWRVVRDPPVRFRRTAGMLPLPMPVPGGSVEALRLFLNVKRDADFALVIAWLLAALRDSGPYPVLALSGEQGAAKSTFSAILRALLDPNSAPLRALPREDRDLFIAASNGHVLAFDNVSGLPAWISDTLCRLATGGGFAVRQLYTDSDEVLFDAMRPIILNGIDDIITRSDLADRSLLFTLDPIDPARRQTENELWAAFDEQRPRILGALLNAVSHGLKMLPTTKLERLPRMADFAIWATACEGALWPARKFEAAYAGNRAEAVESVVDADSVATAVVALMNTTREWSGTATGLLQALTTQVNETVSKAKKWPADPSHLSSRLRRAATFLRAVGIEIAVERDKKTRIKSITIRKPEKSGNSPFGAFGEFAPKHSSGLGPNGERTANGDANGQGAGGTGGPSATNPLESKEANGANGPNGKIPQIFGEEGEVDMPDLPDFLDRRPARQAEVEVVALPEEADEWTH